MPASRDPLAFAFAQTWIQTAEASPELKEEELLPVVKQMLVEKGLSGKHIDSLHASFRSQPIILKRGAVLNPEFLQSMARKQLHFFLVDARYASYHFLREILERAAFDSTAARESFIQLLGDYVKLDRVVANQHQ